MSWLSGWTYRKPHVINQTTGAGEGYQIAINVHYTDNEDSGNNVYLNGKCKGDFGDIRFTASDGSSELDYWMEEKTDNTSARFWVEVSGNLNSSDVTIYLYYGNASATYTDVYSDLEHGERTFLFFDNFDDASIDSSKWDVVGSCSESGGAITVGSSSNEWNYIRSDDTFSRPCKILARLNIDNRSTSMSHNGLIFATNNGGAEPWVGASDLNFHGLSWKNVSPVKVTCSVANSTTSWDSDTYFGSFNVFGVYWDVDETEFVLGSDIQANIGSSYSNPVYLFISDYDANKYTRCDWVFVANYVDSEPTHGTWGNEEQEDYPSCVEANFETGDTSEFDDKLESNGVVTVTDSVSHHPTHSCKCDVNADGNAYAEGYFDINPDIEVIYCRGYFRFNQLPETNKDYTIISFEDTTGPTNIGYVQLIDDNGTKKWGMKRTIMNDATVYTTSTSNIPSVDTWVCVEFAHGGGVAKLWVDGTEVMTYTNAVDKAIDRVHVGACSSDIDADDTLEIHVDCVVVRDNYIGPESDLNANYLTVKDVLIMKAPNGKDYIEIEAVSGGPILEISQAVNVKDDFSAYGFLGTATDPIKGSGGGAIMMGHGFKSSTWYPEFVLLDTTGGGSNAAATISVDGNGTITEVNVTNGGSNYTFADVTVGGGNGKARLAPVIENGVITSINVYDGGAGYFGSEITISNDPHDTLHLTKYDGFPAHLDLGNLNAVSITIDGVEVISSSRTLANVTAPASIITSGTFNSDLIPTITYDMASFADQNLNQSNDAIFNSVTGSSTIAGLKAGSGQNMVAIVHNGSHGYVTALSGSLIIGSSTGSVSFNMSTTVYPYGANQGNIGTNTYYWGSGWFNYLRYKDLNSFDALDDLALVKNYKTKKIEQNGIEIEVIDHESLPFLNAEKTDINAEPFFDSGKVNGFLLGCVKRLAEEVDMLKGRLAEKENPKEVA